MHSTSRPPAPGDGRTCGGASGASLAQPPRDGVRAPVRRRLRGAQEPGADLLRGPGVVGRELPRLGSEPIGPAVPDPADDQSPPASGAETIVQPGASGAAPAGISATASCAARIASAIAAVRSAPGSRTAAVRSTPRRLGGAARRGGPTTRCRRRRPRRSPRRALEIERVLVLGSHATAVADARRDRHVDLAMRRRPRLASATARVQ